jgi:hypothetical protein
MFARDWMKDRKGRRDFAANVYGKPKEEVELTNKEPLIIKIVKASDATGNSDK